jgi:hypothetical protein
VALENGPALLVDGLAVERANRMNELVAFDLEQTCIGAASELVGQDPVVLQASDVFQGAWAILLIKDPEEKRTMSRKTRSVSRRRSTASHRCGAPV